MKKFLFWALSCLFLLSFAKGQDLVITSMELEKDSLLVAGYNNADVTLKNIGDNSLSRVTSRAVISTDTIIDVFDYILDYDYDNTTLNPGDSVLQYLYNSFPEEIEPGDYYVVVTVDYNNEVDEENEENNTTYLPVKIRDRATLPRDQELFIESVGNVTTGSDIEVPYQVINNGTETITGYSLRLGFGTDNDEDGDFEYKINLGSGSSILPGDTLFTNSTISTTGYGPGDLYLKGYLDVYNNVEESNEDNNYSFQPIELLASDIDLIVDDFTLANTTLYAGGKMDTIHVTIKNLGTTDIGEYEVKFYISADTLFQPTDFFLFSYNGNTSLAADESFTTYFLNRESRYPEAGSFYMLAVIDPANKIPENDEDNNTSYQQVLVDIGEVELVGSFESITETNVTNGQTINVVGRIQNTGSINAYPCRAGMYLSHDTVYDEHDYELVETYYSSGINAGYNNTYGNNITIPQNIVTGTYYIVFSVDARDEVPESDETNNYGHAEIHVTSPNEMLDLALQSCSLDDSTFYGTGDVQVTSLVENLSSTNAENSYVYVGFYLSTDNAWDQSDTYLVRDYIYTPDVGPGETLESTYQVSMEESTDTGSYYLLAVLNYQNNAGFESTYGNNITAIPVQVRPPAEKNIDLVPLSVSLNADTIISGARVYVDVELANLGGNTTSSGSVNVGLYLSSGPTLETAYDRKLVNYYKTIGGNDTINFTCSYTLSSDINDAYLFVCADFEKVVPEINEDNNYMSAPIHIKNTNADPVVSIDSIFPSLIVAESNATVYSSVEYLGTDTGYTFSVRYYLSDDSIFNEIGDYFIGNETLQDTIGTFSSQINMPQIANGNYYLLTIVDKYDNIEELNENNNVDHAIITITDPDIDIVLENASVNAVDTVKTGQQDVEIIVEVKNQGLTSTVNDFDMSIYLSQDQVYDVGDLYVSSENINALDPAESYVHTRYYDFPTLEKGTYFMLINLDVNDEVDETNEGNNTIVLPIVIEPRDIDLRFVTAGLSRDKIKISDYFYVEFEIENGGNEAFNTGSYAYTYLSADAFLDETDVFLDDIYIGNKEPGETAWYDDYTSLDVDVKGTNYIIIHLDAEEDLPEINEANNYTSLPIQIGNFDGGDFEFGEISLNNDTIVPNLNFSVDVDILNIDTVDTYLNKLSIYLSEDNEFDREKDARKTYYNVNSIGANSQVNLDYTMYWTDDVMPGNYTLFFVMDEDNDQLETDETNNVKGVPLTVLEVDVDARAYFSPSQDDTIYTGSSIRGYVLNEGTGPSDKFYTQLFISTDSILNTMDDIRLNGYHYGFDFDNDSIPIYYGAMPSYPSGDYYLILKADKYNTVPEDNEENNTIIKKVYFSNDQFDLAIDSLEISESVISSNMYIDVSARLYNNSSAEFGNLSIPTTVYLSTDTIFDNTDDYIINLTWQVPDPGNSSMVSLSPYFSIGENNTYYVLVVADPNESISETNESNNMAYAQLIYNDPANTSYADYIITDATVSNNRVEKDTYMEINYQLENIGNSLSGYSYTQVFLSVDSIYSKNDVYLEQDYNSSLGGGISRTEFVSYTLDEPVEPGTYYIILVANKSQSIKEPDYANNVYVFDIVVEEVNNDLELTTGFNTDTLILGQQYTMSSEVKNLGLADVGSYSTGFFISTDTIYNTYDYKIRSSYSTYIDSGAIRTNNFDFEINKLSPGEYYIIAEVDYVQEIEEVNEANNKVVLPITLVESQADLTVENIAVTGDVIGGDTVHISFDIRNIGADDVGTAYANVYLSKDTYIHSLNKIAEGDLPVGTLAAGASNPFTFDLAIPDLATGNYNVVVVVDGDDDVPEANEENNSSYLQVHVNGYPVPVRGLTSTGETLCNEGEVTLTAGGATGSETYQWFNESGIPLEGETGSTFTTTINRSMTFYVAVDSSGYYSNKTPVEAALVDPVDTDFYLDGYTLELSDPDENATYSWYFDDGPIGADSASVSVANTLSGVYRLDATRGECNFSSEAYVHVDYKDLVSLAPMMENDTLQILSVDNPFTDTVMNVGNVTSYYFYYEVFLSEDTVYDEGDISLYYSYISSLDSAEKIFVDITLDFDLSVPRGQYYLLSIADAREDVDEVNEVNNKKIVPLYLVPPDIDLVPVNYSLQGDSTLRGEYFSMQTQIANIGNTDVETRFEIGYYLSADTMLDVLDYRFDYGYLNSLMAGDTSSMLGEGHSMYFDPGHYHVLIKADYEEEIPELNEQNNIAVLPFTIYVHQGGDLYIQDAEFEKDTVVYGDNASLTIDISNRGPEQTANGEMYFYVSNDTILDFGEDRFLEWGYYSSLAPGDVDREYAIIEEGEYKPGKNYVFCVLDSEGVQNEHDEENNISYYPFVVVEDKSDFTISWEEAPSDTLYPWNSTLSYRIGNNGEGDSRSVHTHVYLSKDTIADHNDVNIFATSFNLNKDESVIYTASDIPSLENGEYYILVFADTYNEVDEPDESDNTLVQKVQVKNGNYDLLVENFALDFDTIHSNTDVEALFSFANAGTDTIKTYTNINFYLSSDTVLNMYDELVDYYYNYDGLNPGSSTDADKTFTLEKYPNGRYYVLGSIDDDNRVIEANENNNIVYAPVEMYSPGDTNTLDLYISDVILYTEYLVPGLDIQLQYYVEKTEFTSTSSSFYTRVYLSKDSVLDKNDEQLQGTDWIYYMGSGSVNDYIYPRLSENADTGKYYLITYVDQGHAIHETDETNNTFVTEIYIEDYYIDIQSLIDPLTADTAISKTRFPVITKTVNNSHIDLASTHESIYLSTDTIFDISDIGLDRNLYVHDVDSGSTRQYYRYVDLPDIPEGTYYLLQLSDVNDKYKEVNEDNNLAFKKIYVKGNQLDLTIDCPFSVAEVLSGDTLLLPFTVVKSGNRDISGFYITAALSSDAEFQSNYDYISPGAEDYFYMDTITEINDTLMFIIPDLASGIKNILIILDTYNGVYELDENNNQHLIRLKINDFSGPKPPVIVRQDGFCNEGDVMIVASGANEDNGLSYTWFASDKSVIEGEKSDTLQMYFSEPGFLYVAIDSAGVYGEKRVIYIQNYYPDTAVTREGNVLTVADQSFSSTIQWIKDSEGISNNYSMDAAEYGSGYYSVTVTNAFCEATNQYGYIEVSGIYEIVEGSTSVEVYPNPAHDRLHVLIDGLNEEGYWLELYDQKGSKIKQVRMHQGFDGLPATVDISKLPQGSYILKIMNKDKVIGSKIIIKR